MKEDTSNNIRILYIHQLLKLAMNHLIKVGDKSQDMFLAQADLVEIAKEINKLK